MVYEGVEYVAKITCRVMNNLSSSLVLGLHEISGPFLQLHIAKLLSASPGDRSNNAAQLFGCLSPGLILQTRRS
jgi:hypothetical protein